MEAMISSALNLRIILSDQEIEDHRTLESLLRIVIRGDFTLKQDGSINVTTVRIAQKCDFEIALKWIAIKTRYALSLRHDLSGVAILVEVALNDKSLCALGLQRGGKAYAGQESGGVIEKEFGTVRSGASLQDSAALGLNVLRNLSHDVLWAWLRAFRNTLGPFGVAAKEGQMFKDLGTEFRRLMALESQSFHCGMALAKPVRRMADD